MLAKVSKSPGPEGACGRGPCVPWEPCLLGLTTVPLLPVPRAWLLGFSRRLLPGHTHVPSFDSVSTGEADGGRVCGQDQLRFDFLEAHMGASNGTWAPVSVCTVPDSPFAEVTEL